MCNIIIKKNGCCSCEVTYQSQINIDLPIINIFCHMYMLSIHVFGGTKSGFLPLLMLVTCQECATGSYRYSQPLHSNHLSNILEFLWQEKQVC